MTKSVLCLQSFVQPQNKNIAVGKNFQGIVFYGQAMSFGRAQANIIRQLYNAGKTGQPYIHYKTLLKNADVRSSFMRDVFKSNLYWQKIIKHDRRGFYWLDEAFFEKKSERQQSNVTKSQIFQNILFNGEYLSFDRIQADIIKQLYDAGLSGHPYVHFKTLLRNAGVRPSFIREMSNSNPHWRKIIGHDRGGFYRLDEAFFPKKPGTQQTVVTMDSSFQSICFCGEYLSFGRIQADIIKQLYDAGLSGHPYVHFKILLRNTDSRSFFMRDAFKCKPHWRKIIRHNRRGFYRLDEAFFPKNPGAQQPIVTIDPSFQSICFRGEHLTFGLVQAHIIRQLYDAGKTCHPYVHFTDLLEGTGCFSLYPKEIFKPNAHWRKIIQMEAPGFYRLHEAFFKADCVQAVSQFPNQNITRNNDFRSIYFYGEYFVFGATQANIIRRLYRAGKSDRPYIHGSVLLEATGLNYEHISAIFNWRPYWRKIIESDGKGFYRLNRAFFKEEPAKISV